MCVPDNRKLRLTSHLPYRTLFDPETSSWLQKESADPIEGWPLEIVRGLSAKYGTPDRDLYGLLYFYVREKLTAFCNKIANSKMLFHFYCTDASTLGSLIDKDLKFDRVEVANIVDRTYLGLKKTLMTCGSLLKSPSTNPHAVLVALFMAAVDEVADGLGPDYMMEHMISASPKTQRFIRGHKNLHKYHPTWIRVIAANDIFRDNDFLFKHYMKQVDFDKAGRETKMKMKEKNTVMEAWPYRFTKKAGEPGAQKAFDLLESSGGVGSERYVEWVRSERALEFLSNASNETLGACIVGLAAVTWLVLERVGLVLIGERVGLVLIGIVGGVVLSCYKGRGASRTTRMTKPSCQKPIGGGSRYCCEGIELEEEKRR